MATSQPWFIQVQFGFDQSKITIKFSTITFKTKEGLEPCTFQEALIKFSAKITNASFGRQRLFFPFVWKGDKTLSPQADPRSVAFFYRVAGVLIGREGQLILDQFLEHAAKRFTWQSVDVIDSEVAGRQKLIQVKN